MKPFEQEDQLEENLRAAGRGLREARGPSEELLTRCLEALERRPAKPWRTVIMQYKRPMLLSTLSLAAGLALVVGVIWPHAEPKVRAELVVASLAKQSEQNPLLDVRIENLVLEELQVNGNLRVGKSGVAGDISVSIDEDEGTLQVDASLGFGGKDHNWVLVRNLSLPDAEAQAFLSLFMPTGVETLLLLPADSEIAEEVGEGIREGLAELRSGEVVAAFKEILQSHGEYGIAVKNQADGTVLLTLPLGDEEALEQIAEKLEALEGLDLGLGKAQKHAVERHAARGADSKDKKNVKADNTVEAKAEKKVDRELADAVLNVIYDPNTDTVKMLQVTGFGGAKGSITLRLLDGDIDAAMLDPKRVTKPGTRTIDVSALESMIEGLTKHMKE